jgi:NTE family protein
MGAYREERRVRAGQDRKRVAIACQGGGSHTAFTAGVLKRLFQEAVTGYEVVGLSGTSGGAICALLAWYALREDDPASAGPLLDEFWADNSASTPVEQMVNATTMLAGEFQRFFVSPAISPYDNVFAAAGADEFRRMLERRVDFDRLEVEPSDEQPLLVIGAVDVLSGDFRAFDSRRDRISADTILASAAIPTLFRSVHLDGGTYWDGLFSQNPPIRELIDARPDEIWVIQINPKERETEPMTVADIADRRNELAGNLSLHQELHFIEKIDQMLEAGVLAGDGRYKSIMVRVIELSPARLPRSLGVISKLNRDPGFIRDLIDHGQAQADEFLTALSFEQAWRAGDTSAMMSLFADDVGFSSTQPFPDAPASAGAEHVGTFLKRHLKAIVVDATRKQVARDRVTWSLKAQPGTGSPLRGQAEMTLEAGQITSLRLGPSRRRARPGNGLPREEVER